MVFDRKTLVIPNETINENNHLQVSGDIILDDRAEVDYTLETEKRIFVGEWVKVHGDMTAEDDIRIDRFSEVRGNISGGNDIYLGERVHVLGKLTVGKDLDVGTDVAIEDGFDAKGWINIRNPIPLIIYFFIYLFNLIKRGKSEEVERILREIDAEDQTPEEILVSDNFFFVPTGSKVDPEAIDIKGNCRIGSNCKLMGTYHVAGTVKLGDETEFIGNITAQNSITLGNDVNLVGSMETKEHVIIGQGCTITGDIVCKTLEMVQNSTVEGIIHAPDGIKIIPVAAEEMDEKIRKFDQGLDGLDEIL
ncbi:polymer-forming cytoskeletal protein [[Eubacterium] cellulosolvens]